MIATLRLSLASALMALALAGAAHAQAPKNPAPSPGATETQAMHGLARCVVSRSREDTRAVLKLDQKTPAYREALIALAKKHSQCTFASIRMGGTLFPGALAEAMLRKDWDKAGLAGILHTPEPALTARDDAEYTGMCLVLAQPQEAAALLFSDPVSTEAATLLSGFAPRLASCVHKGQTLRINKAGLRAIMALSAYRLAAVNSATGKI